MNLTKRQRDLIYALPRGNHFITSQELSNKLKVSEKTIRNEIKIINEQFKKPELIVSFKGKGYRLNRENPNYNYIFSEKYKYNEDSFKQQMQILKYLMDQSEVDILDLCDALFIGEKRLKNDIAALNRRIKKRTEDVMIIAQNGKLILKGTEEDHRKVFTYFLINAIKEFNFSIENYQEYFSNVQVHKVQEMLIDFFSEHQVQMNDLDIFSLMLHISICIDRIRTHNTIVCEMDLTFEDTYHVEQLCRRIARLHDVYLQEDELRYLILLFYTKLPKETMPLYFKEDTEVFVQKVIQEMKQQFHISLENDQEWIRLLQLHLVTMFHRIQNHTYLKNPLVQDVKNQFPMIYDMGVFIAVMIQKEYQITLNEDEIGYLTIHLMSAIERQNYFWKIKVALVNPAGKVSTSYMRNKLERRLGNRIEIVGDFSLFEVESLKEMDIDLIITTAVIIKDLGIKVEQCSIGVTDYDLQRIEIRLKEIEHRRNLYLRENIPLFYPSLFFPQMSFTSKEEVLTFLCSKLEEQGFCDSSYFDAVMERERIAPTSFGNCFAIPHPVKRKALKNALAVCSLKNSILWNEHKVSLILLFSATEDELVFDRVYESIVGMLNHLDKVKKLCKVSNFSSFVNLFYDDEGTL